MTPEQKAKIDAANQAMDPLGAIALAIALSVCHSNADKLSPDQKKDILNAGLDLYRTAVAAETIKAITLGKPDAAIVAARAAHAFTRAAGLMPQRVERFYTLASMASGE